MFCCCAFFLNVGVSRAAERITLEDAISTALEKSPLLAANRQEVVASGYGINAATGQLLPQVGAYAGYTRLSDPAAVVPIKAFGGTPPFFSRDHYRAGVTVKIPVFQGGIRWKELTAARLAEEVSRQSLVLTRQELVANITNVFNKIIYLEQEMESSGAVLGALKKARDDAEVRLKAGRIAPVDLMRMESQVAAQEQALTSAREECVRSRQLLSQLMGLDPSLLPEVEGELSPPAISSSSFSDGDFDDEIEQRPDIKRAEKEVEVAENQVKLLQGYHLPAVDLVGDYGRKAGSGFDGNEETWSGGITLSMNVFSGGVISSRVKQARARLIAAQERLRNSRLAAKAQIHSAVSRLREAKIRYATAVRESDTARETWRIEELRYRKGAGSVTDSLLAQSAWKQAETRKLAALYDWNAADVEYRLATGTIDADILAEQSRSVENPASAGNVVTEE